MKSSRVRSPRLASEAFNSARMSRATGSLVMVLVMKVCWFWWGFHAVGDIIGGVLGGDGGNGGDGGDGGEFGVGYD